MKHIGKFSASVAAMAMAFGVGSVHAADLGGNCCADLEERVAELEATTARKGNRKVSLKVSGQVHEAIVYFDAGDTGDENESNTYIGTHNASRSRLRFEGQADFAQGWSAGFLIEIGVRANDLSDLDQDTPQSDQKLDIRHEALWIKSRNLGTFWLGQTSSAMDGITEICLGCAIGATADFAYDMGNLIAGNGDTFDSFGSAAGSFSGEGDRREVVRYLTPPFAGFSVSASWGGDDYWDAALRYAAEFGSIRVAAGVGYGVDTDESDTNILISGASCGVVDDERDCRSLGASASIQHTPSGLYLAGAYGQNKDHLADAGEDTNQSWHVVGGWRVKATTLGWTNFYGLYTEAEREIGQNSKLTVYGLGVEQGVDAAAMTLYFNYKHLDAELEGEDEGDADIVTFGALIKF